MAANPMTVRLRRINLAAAKRSTDHPPLLPASFMAGPMPMAPKTAAVIMPALMILPSSAGDMPLPDSLPVSHPLLPPMSSVRTSGTAVE